MHKGDTFHWNIYGTAATAGGTLAETGTMPETNFTVTQGTLRLSEYGNSVPYTSILDDSSEQDVRGIIHQVLKVDAKDTLDRAAFAQFNATPLRVVPTAGTSSVALTLTTNGTATLTNNVGFGPGHVKALVDLMKERNIPAYQGESSYVAISRPSTLRKLKDSLEALHQYTGEGLRMVMNGEQGRYEGVRFVEQTNIASSSWTNGLSDKIIFFGDDTVAEAISTAEEIRGKLPGDYGRDKGVAWYYVGGFGLSHTDPTQTRVVVWDSAA
jgi:N4-gp56 family major capsid protein